ncbi:MAG: aminoacyl-tRNA hydrolase [Spirochaetaceae bacterium]|jgi:PTH1 family peptidyl-tRNA hydrolase|nr:aminoacyl-tRNA hydrolase [Spirochaetaceae bacterium]
MIELVVFLGNPGREYQGNRHNVGRRLAETLPFFSDLNWERKYKGYYAALDGSRLPAYQSAGSEPAGPAAREKTPPAKVRFLMPETYMNLSGDSVYAAASFFRILPERILVIHDELELPLGTAALKFAGGLGGHNGLRSIKANFGTADFWRLRIGIGRPNHDDISLWVLSDFEQAEKPVLEQVLAAATAALIRVLLEGPEALLPEWTKKKI